jgi:iron(III) transport system ATP-binding protein
VLLFDEPLSNLDARLRRRVREDIRDLQKRLGLSVVYVTHDQQEALAVSDLVCVMRAGKIAQMGTPNELYEDPADAFIADFMGEANVLQGEVVGPGRIALGGVALETQMRDHPTGPAQLAVRPESVTLTAAGEGLPGRIGRAAFLGQTREYEIETAAGMLFVVTPAAAPAFAPGDAVACRLDRVIPLRA